jgi:histone-lysine N-methyltransferase SETD3
MMICSRVFGVEMEGKQTDILVAYADMLNHKRPRQTSWFYDDQRKGFVIDALSDIKLGEQVYDSYGRKCNTRFLLNYGFMNPNNDGDEFPFRAALDSENDENYQTKKALLGTEPSSRSYRMLASINEENT